MPKRKSKHNIETIDELVAEIQSAENTVNNELKPKIIDTEDKKTEDEIDRKRNEFLKLAEDGDFDKSVAYIKKCSQKVIDKLYTEYERKRMQKANEFLTDLLISRFSSILGKLDAIIDPDELSKELKKDELLKGMSIQ